MRVPTAVFTFLLALAVPAVHAQSNQPEKKAPETPPDAKAFRDANQITDPAQKVAALEKFKKDFPNSSSVEAADFGILSALASGMPDQTARIQQVAKGLLKGAKNKKTKASLANQIAGTLLTNKVLLKDAENYAQIGVNGLNERQFVADQKAQFAKFAKTAKDAEERKPPTEAELIKRFNQSRASRLATLGRIQFELGNMPAAIKTLTEAHAEDRDQPGAQATLGEIALQKGDYPQALEYLVAARLGGQSSPSTIAALSSAYSKTHNGDTAGLEEMLDAEYHKRFPEPLHLDVYQPSAKRSDRLVLAEVFTGAGCPPCVGADLAFDAAMQRYSRKDLMVLMYHQHIPKPDPMANSDTAARLKYYDVRGVPTYFIDGGSVKFNGAGREETKSVWEHIQQPIEKELESPAEAKIAVNASAAGNSVKVAASIDGVKSQSKDLKVQVVLLEKELTYSGENGIRFHPMVVRAMGGKDDDGFAFDPTAPAPVEQTFDLDKISAGLKTQLDDYEAKGHRGSPFKFVEKKYQIDRGNLAVVVFVQDAKTKHILDAAYVDLNPAAQHIPTSSSGGAR
ncbi:MAG TPA: Omp28-related outer membrane protein [Bryobacteraceae bacterium]|nr:Omp28-related outer membrane protein [Bryobacteraceae bacterium]